MKILDLIPQREPFVMIDELLIAENDFCKTSFLLKDTNIFNKNGIIQEGALIENMAQTAAASFGYQSLNNQKKIPIGYIAAIKKLKIKKLLSVGKKIETEIRKTNYFDNFVIVEARIICENNEVACCNMTIFLDVKT